MSKKLWKSLEFIAWDVLKVLGEKLVYVAKRVSDAIHEVRENKWWGVFNKEDYVLSWEIDG